MQIIITENYEELSKKAYEELKKTLTSEKSPVLGLATGSSPIGLYKEMIADCKAKNASYKNVRTVNLDEYVGLDEKSDQSYVRFMNDILFSHIDIDKSKTNLPNGKAANMQIECDRYTALLNSMPQDIQVLGIGTNGHIGFNEPGTAFNTTTHIVELEEGTRKDNARFFASLDEVPTHAITMGIQNIMNSKKILVVANGAAKADVVYAMVKGDINEKCPASILQKHKNVVVVLDKDAAAKL